MRGQRHAPAAPYTRERPGTHCTGGWVGLRAGLYRCGKSRPHWNFFLLYQHVQYTFIMSCGIHAPLSTLLPLDPLSPPVCRSMQVTTDTHLLGARNIHLFTDGIHSPVSRHPSIRTYEIIQGLTDSFLLGRFDPRNVQPVGSRYTDYATRPTHKELPSINFVTLDIPNFCGFSKTVSTT